MRKESDPFIQRLEEITTSEVGAFLGRGSLQSHEMASFEGAVSLLPLFLYY